jgi:hypothetical protein
MAVTLDVMVEYHRRQIENKKAILVVDVTDPQNVSTRVTYERPDPGNNDSSFSNDVVKAWDNYNLTQGVIIIIVNTETPKTTMQIKHFPWLPQDAREKLCMKCGLKHDLVECPDISEEARQSLRT